MQNITNKISGLGKVWGVKVVMLSIVFVTGVFSGRYLFPVATVSAQEINYSMVFSK